MSNLRTFLILYLNFLTKYSHTVLALALKDLEIHISDNVADLSSHARRLEEEFKYDGRIVGGFVTSIANYPYQVSLQYHNAHICGGSIVAHNIILTAAHCIEQPWDTASFRVRAGSSTHLYGGQLVGVRHIFKHEAYSSLPLDSDVALVVLNKNLTYTRTVQPVELAAWGEQLPNNYENEFLVSGWGLTSEMGVIAPLLNYVAVRLINQNTCSENYQYIATITSKMFCAGYPQGGKDSCQGDSGGPLVSYVSSTTSLSLTSTAIATNKPVFELQANVVKPKQYGIVSWGVGCAQKNYPGVYAKVAALRPWIDAKINEVNYL